MDEPAHDKHVQMANAISDCQVLLCGGMGTGAYESMRRLNIQPVVTDLSNIDEAVQAYVDGKLVDHTEKTTLTAWPCKNAKKPFIKGKNKWLKESA